MTLGEYIREWHRLSCAMNRAAAYLDPVEAARVAEELERLGERWRKSGAQRPTPTPSVCVDGSPSRASQDYISQRKAEK